MTETDSDPHDTSDSPAEETSSEGGHWLVGPDVGTAPLPGSVSRAFERFLGDSDLQTPGDLATSVRTMVGGGGITVDALCHAEGPTDHRGILGNDVYYFECFYDAALLAELVDEPVDIRTASPDGVAIEAWAVGSNDPTVRPSGAAASIGIATDALRHTDTTPSLAAAYRAICPYVKAFPDRTAYREWAADTNAATVGLPLAAAIDFAGRMIHVAGTDEP